MVWGLLWVFRCRFKTDDMSIENWIREHPFEAIEVDCAAAVMLKILDGKCKMDADEKVVMTQLYDGVSHRAGELLGDEVHRLIAEARSRSDDTLRERIYELRVLAETRIARPRMKCFKAMIRHNGLFDVHMKSSAA